MTKRARDGDVKVPSLPPPSFISLPDIAHATIASFLPEGDKRRGSRSRVSGLSRALLGSYGGSLTCANLRKIKNGSAARLAALMRRQTKLESVSVTEHETLHAFSEAVAQGCCRGVESIELGKDKCWAQRPVDLTHLDILAGALEVGGGLPAIKTLKVHFRPTLHVLSTLARALMGGTLPLLEHFVVKQRGLSDDDLNFMANVVEARARIPGCQRLRWFEGPGWLNASPGSVRLLRALLPSLRVVMEGPCDRAR